MEFGPGTIGSANACVGLDPLVHVAHPAPAASTAICGNSTSPLVGSVRAVPKLVAATNEISQLIGRAPVSRVATALNAKKTRVANSE